MARNPTPQQAEIISRVRADNGNLIVRAYAGTGKTTTIELFSSVMNMRPTLCLAFNKRIAEEMAKRLPSHFTCQTLNAFGLSGRKINSRSWVRIQKYPS